ARSSARSGGGWEVLAMIQPDHSHLFVRVWPSESAAEAVKECKVLTSHHLRAAFPCLRTLLPLCWTRSSLASTAGNGTQESMQRYIAAHVRRSYGRWPAQDLHQDLQREVAAHSPPGAGTGAHPHALLEALQYSTCAAHHGLAAVPRLRLALPA